MARRFPSASQNGLGGVLKDDKVTAEFLHSVQQSIQVAQRCFPLGDNVMDAIIAGVAQKISDMFAGDKSKQL